MCRRVLGDASNLAVQPSERDEMTEGRSSEGANADMAPAQVLGLSAWLSECIEGFGTLRRVEKFAGGQSNPTYQIQGSRQSYVLRRKPMGA